MRLTRSASGFRSGMERGSFGSVRGGCSGIDSMEEGRRMPRVVVEDEDGSLGFMMVELVEGF